MSIENISFSEYNIIQLPRPRRVNEKNIVSVIKKGYTK
jgi:hypothetical protein